MPTKENCSIGFGRFGDKQINCPPRLRQISKYLLVSNTI